LVLQDRLDLGLSTETTKRLLHTIDVDESGYVDFTELREWLLGYSGDDATEEGVPLAPKPEREMASHKDVSHAHHISSGSNIAAQLLSLQDMFAGITDVGLQDTTGQLSHQRRDSVSTLPSVGYSSVDVSRVAAHTSGLVLALAIGDRVQVWSKRSACWLDGTVLSLHYSGAEATVSYRDTTSGGGLDERNKRVRLHDRNIVRPTTTPASTAANRSQHSPSPQSPGLGSRFASFTGQQSSLARAPPTDVLAGPSSAFSGAMAQFVQQIRLQPFSPTTDTLTRRERLRALLDETLRRLPLQLQVSEQHKTEMLEKYLRAEWDAEAQVAEVRGGKEKQDLDDESEQPIIGSLATDLSDSSSTGSIDSPYGEDVQTRIAAFRKEEAARINGSQRSRGDDFESVPLDQGRSHLNGIHSDDQRITNPTVEDVQTSLEGPSTERRAPQLQTGQRGAFSFGELDATVAKLSRGYRAGIATAPTHR
jgi:hypothetical protein